MKLHMNKTIKILCCEGCKHPIVSLENHSYFCIHCWIVLFTHDIFILEVGNLMHPKCTKCDNRAVVSSSDEGTSCYWCNACKQGV